MAACASVNTSALVGGLIRVVGFDQAIKQSGKG
jgi:hypothetical protein